MGFLASPFRVPHTSLRFGYPQLPVPLYQFSQGRIGNLDAQEVVFRFRLIFLTHVARSELRFA